MFTCNDRLWNSIGSVIDIRCCKKYITSVNQIILSDLCGMTVSGVMEPRNGESDLVASSSLELLCLSASESNV